jgi:7,8-dihydropterin-6-yl-methyl-4-(beta-D-ribofuranosyl)aminobenzene 5'-phosphate synthase
MELTVLYDNEAADGYEPAWGFSCLVKKAGVTVLFDTGWDGDLLLRNLRRFDTDPEAIDHLVISHQHWDHVGGVPQVLHAGLTVWMPAGPSRRISDEVETRCVVHRVEGPCEIASGIRSTGLLGDAIPEQSLLLDAADGLFVLTGCAHPGIDRILGAASAQGNVVGILGGFHDFEDLDALAGLRTIVPGHCTRRKQDILSRYAAVAVPCKVGLTLRIDD